MNKTRQTSRSLGNVAALCIALLALPVALPSRADAATDSPEEFVLPDSVSTTKLRKLSLREAIAIAIANNLGIQLQRQRIEVGRANIASSEAGFEPRLSASFDHNDSVSPPQSSLDGVPGSTFENVSQRWTLGLSKRLSMGTTLGLNFFSSRNRSGSGSAVEPLFYGSNLSFSINQPLLRGFSLDRDIPRATILRAEFGNQKNLEEQRIVMAREVRRTEDAYWSLVQSTRSYAVQKQSLQLANDQLDITQKQIKAGILAPADLIASESSVAQRELSLLQSESDLEATMDRLRTAMNLPRSEWSQFLLAVDLPQVTPRSVTVEEALQQAMQLRPEIRQNELDQELATLDHRVARNNHLPELNVGFRYGVVGQSNVYSGSLTQLEGLGARNWGVFVNLNWAPLGKEASANARSLRAQTKIQALRYQQFLSNLQSELRAAIRRLKTTQRQVVASVRFRELAQRSLEVERKRFLNGTSRNIEVSRREEDFARAKTAEIAARIDYFKAGSDLDLATGTLLKNKGIELKLIK